MVAPVPAEEVADEHVALVHDEPQQLAAAQNKMIVADLGVDYCSIRVAVSCEGRIQVDSVIS